MKNSRVLYYDVLNVISCVSVVCMHSNGYVHKFVKDEWWWLRVLIEVLCYFAVPVFFMLSGATLLRYNERYSTKMFYRKRLLKTFIPFLFWGGCFYILYFFIKGWGCFQLKEVLENFTYGKIPFTNYWFFIPLFFLYLFIPFFSLMVERIPQRMMLLLILILVLFQSVFPLLYSMMDVKFDISLPVGGFAFYALLGYYISHSNIEENRKVLLMLGVFTILSLTIRYYLLYFSEEKDPMLFTYYGLYAIIPSAFVFILAKRYSYLIGFNSTGSFWTKLSKRSYGVYLIHTLLIVMLSKLIGPENPWFILLSIMVVYFSSIIIVCFMQRIKLLRVFVP